MFHIAYCSKKKLCVEGNYLSNMKRGYLKFKSKFLLLTYF